MNRSCLLTTFFCLLSFVYSSFSLASPEVTSTAVKPPTLAQIASSCTYNYTDTYASTMTGSTPVTTAYVGQGGNNYPTSTSPSVSLQFNNFGGSPSPSSQTSAVPCNGYYAVAFTMDLRFNNDAGCSYGDNAFTLWVTSSDPTMKNVYGCQVLYQGYGQTWYNPNGAVDYPTQLCGVYNQWVQCAWGTNWSGTIQNDLSSVAIPRYSSTGFPYFSYTPSWGVGGGYYNFGAQYPNMCLGNFCQIGPGYDRVNGTPATEYCAQKTFNFKSIVYLHQGATVSAPQLWSYMRGTVYAIDFGNYSGQACSMSVVGGRFTVTYLHP